MHNTRVSAGDGFTYPKMLGGPGGKVYAINNQGLWRYRWSGSGWLTEPNGNMRRQISTSFTQYATAAYRDKITVDEIGDIYLIDGNGHLRWYRYDEATSSFSINRTIDTGWGQYNLLVAAGPGVLYSRTPAGELYRSRFEPTSQRWIQEEKRIQNGTWNNFTRGIFSAGGDTLFGIQADGDLFHYRWIEDENRFVVMAKGPFGGWQIYANVYALTDTCKLTDRRTPARPATPIQPYSPTVAIQRPTEGTALGAIEYVYADNIGSLRHGYQPNPDDFDSIQWSTVDTPEAFTGRPSLFVNPQGNVRMLAHNTNSDAWSFTRAAAPSTSWGSRLDLGGAMKSRPVAVRLSDGTPAAFGLDADGALWHRKWDTTANDLLVWTKLGGSGLTGELTAVAGPNRAVTLFALDADGTPVTADYVDGTVSAWADLGGSGFTASPAVVTLPGQIRRLFARAADGQILTQAQTSAGVWPGTWAPVGTFASAGPPAAVLDPPTGRLTVVARGTDNEIYKVFETATGSGVWGDWKLINDDQLSDPSTTDPTIAPYANAAGQTYLIVFRNANDATRVYERKNGPGATARAGRKAAGAEPLFTSHQVPAPRQAARGGK